MLLPFTLLVLALGTLLVLPVVDTVRDGVSSARVTFEREAAYYAADATTEAVLSDLRRGVDVLDSGYIPPSVTLNNYTATVTITAPPRADVLPFGAVFADPQTATSLNPLPARTEFLYRLFNVRPFADFQVNWAYTPTDGSVQIQIFEGDGTVGAPIITANANNSPLRFTLDAKHIKGGTYTIRFYNNSSFALTSAPFSTIGAPDKTWVRITAFKDYLITATAGNVTLVVFARQGPGPNQISSSVHVSTWHGPN